MPGFKVSLTENTIHELSLFIKNYDYEADYVAEVKEAGKGYTVETVVDGLEIPWGMEFLPDGDMLIAEKNGTLSRFSKTTGLTPIKGLPRVRSAGQGGLMDLKLHPQYDENGWLYISYSYIDTENSKNGNTAIIRARLRDNALVDIQEIYRGYPAVSTNHHFGNRMVFDREGYLYFSNGERGRRDDFPQKLDNTNGKIHRLHDDGSIPADNPFVGQPDVAESIYSYGHRNPQGLALHPETGAVWEHEHGPRGGDEINIIKKGANYGWPVISYGINYNGTIFTDLTEQEGMEQPLFYYVPSIAPCGMAFLTSDKYPNWKNNLLIGSLRFHYLERLVLKDNLVIHQEKMLEELDSRVRDVRVGPDGYIYVALEGPGGLCGCCRSGGLRIVGVTRVTPTIGIRLQFFTGHLFSDMTCRPQSGDVFLKD
ncbi:MAG: PQQ-dependent sugar dehydrogenase [Lewinellaceae bacterium]|nr:PQQ-dependent sugar dehydrogenase [Lewinellaceae bacterium]